MISPSPEPLSTRDDPWPEREPPAPLLPGRVHLWRIAIDHGREPPEEAWRLLSAVETARARRFLVDAPRRTFVTCHAVLRRLLGAYTGRPPASLVFAPGPFGKPELLTAGEGPSLRFNLSHAGDWGLVGIARAGRIGVDVEQCRPLRDMDALAEACFSTRELATYRALEQSSRADAFFAAWTRKEAFIKATGRGLGFPLRDFDVALAPGDAPRVLRIQGDDVPAADWSLRSVAPAAGYAGALAVDRPIDAVECFTFAGA